MTLLRQAFHGSRHGHSCAYLALAMRAPTGSLYINKIAAASRQLDAAIRMFFAKEDDLAVHTVASAAFRILRDVTKKRGKNIATEVIRDGIYRMAREYAEGKMSQEMLNDIKNTALMDIIKRIVEDERAQNNKFDLNRILITNERANEQRAWPSKAANFLKHADRDHEEHLAVDALENESVLIGASVTYLELMKMPTPEIVAFCAFWAVKNDTDTAAWKDQELLLKLRYLDEPARYGECRKYIHQNFYPRPLRLGFS